MCTRYVLVAVPSVCCVVDTSCLWHTQGTFVDGKRHGKGTLERRDGSSYEGEWRSDRRNGQGTETYVNRDVYSGKWVADKPSGRGRYVYAAGHSYEGIWSDGMRMGKVRLPPPERGQCPCVASLTCGRCCLCMSQGFYTSIKGTVRSGKYEAGVFIEDEASPRADAADIRFDASNKEWGITSIRRARGAIPNGK